MEWQMVMELHYLHLLQADIQRQAFSIKKQMNKPKK